MEKYEIEEVIYEVDCANCPMCSGKNKRGKTIVGYDCKVVDDDCDEIVEQIYCERKVIK